MPGAFVNNDAPKFLDSADFGHQATYDGNNFNVQFVKEFSAVELFGIEIESSTPFCIARDADVSGIAHGEQFTVDSVVYKVRGVRPDGTGMTIIILSKD